MSAWLLGVLLAGCHHRVQPTPDAQGGMLSEELYWALDERALRITTRQGREVLALPLQRAFLTAWRAEPRVSSELGSFDMDEKVLLRCDHASISELSTAMGSLTVRGDLTGKDCDADYTLTLSPGPDSRLNIEARASGAEVNRLRLTLRAERSERILGGGEQFTHVDLKGHRVPMLSEEQGIGRGSQPLTVLADLKAGAGGDAFTTYFPIPFLMTSEHRALALDGYTYATLDLSDAAYIAAESWSPGIDMTLWWADDPATLLARYTAETGRMGPLPEWAHGTILGVQGGRERVAQILRETQTANNPVSAVWIQDWSGQRETEFGSQLWWRWTPDEARYPDLKGWAKELDKEGVKLLGYVNPFLANEGPMYEEARDAGLLLKDRSGQPYVVQTAGFPAVLLDLSKPEACEWLKRILKENLLANGFSGWMADFSEWLPMDATMADGGLSMEWHNRYPVEWARINREAIREAKLEGKAVFFMRAGYTGSAGQSTLFWAGDQMVSWDANDGLGSAIVAMSSGGLSGIALNHTDIGGYTTLSSFIKDYHRSPELLLRWAEMAAFTPVFRTHEGNRPADNHQFYTDRDTQNHFAAMGRVHWALRGLFADLEAEAAQTGLPVVRHPYLVFPNDPETLKLRYQFMVGEDILVLPVWKKKDTTVRGYFPAGEWEHVWTGTRISGPGWHKIEAPVGTPAAWLRVSGPHYAELRAALNEVVKR